MVEDIEADAPTTRIEAILAPIEALLRPVYANSSDETWQVNGYVAPIGADDLRAALAAARQVLLAGKQDD